MKRKTIIAGLALALITSCSNMENPLLTESTAPFGAPQFDKIRTEHYLPAFEAAIAEAKAEVGAIVANPDEPTFENTIEAMEYSGKTLNTVAGIFYNLMEAHTSDEMQALTRSPCSPRDSQESSPTTQCKSINSSVLSFLYSPTLTSIHDNWKNPSFD